jgi:hypothetical protein
MKDVCFMHIKKGKLYGTSITGQVLCDVLRFPKELNSSEHSLSLTFLLSVANSGYKLSTDFLALLSGRCLNTPSFVRLFACHFIWGTVYCDINNLCSLGMSENYCNTFTERFLLDDIG